MEAQLADTLVAPAIGTGEITTPPLASAQIIRVTGGAGTVTVTWQAPTPLPSGLTRYDVTLLRNGQVADVTCCIVRAGSPLTATFKGLQTNAKYTIRIDTIAWINSSVIRNIDTSVPAAPPGLSVTAGIGTTVLRWGAAYSSSDWPVTSYVLTAAGVPSVTLPGTARSASLKGLVPGRGYTFTVTARNSWGTSAASSRVLAPSALTSALTPTVINYAQVVSVRGGLTSAGRAVPGAVLNVYARRPNVRTWTLVARVRTSSTGAYAYLAKPAASTFYSVQFPGSTSHAGVTAPTRGVSVRTVVSAALSRTIAPLRGTVALRGRGEPGACRAAGRPAAANRAQLGLCRDSPARLEFHLLVPDSDHGTRNVHLSRRQARRRGSRHRCLALPDLAGDVGARKTRGRAAAASAAAARPVTRGRPVIRSSSRRAPARGLTVPPPGRPGIESRAPRRPAGGRTTAPAA